MFCVIALLQTSEPIDILQTRRSSSIVSEIQHSTSCQQCLWSTVNKIYTPFTTGMSLQSTKYTHLLQQVWVYSQQNYTPFTTGMSLQSTKCTHLLQQVWVYSQQNVHTFYNRCESTVNKMYTPFTTGVSLQSTKCTHLLKQVWVYSQQNVHTFYRVLGDAGFSVPGRLNWTPDA